MADQGSQKRRPRLGRGLSTLMGQPVAVENVHAPPQEPATPALTPAGADAAKHGSTDVNAPNAGTAQILLLHLPTGAIQPNRHQPRKQFRESSLAELLSRL